MSTSYPSFRLRLLLATTALLFSAPAARGATLELWLDAQASATITHAAGEVSQWDDRSGNGRDVAQGTASAQPDTGNVTINGFNALHFDGGDQLDNAFDLSNVGMIFAVLKQDATGHSGVFGGNLVVTTSTSQWSLRKTADAANLIDSAIVASAAAAVAWDIVDDDMELFVGGASIGSDTLTNAYSGAITLGVTGSVANLTGEIGEVIMFDDVLTADERTGLFSLMADKWGLDPVAATLEQQAAANALFGGAYALVVPEPGTGLLMLVGLSGLSLRRRRSVHAKPDIKKTSDIQPSHITHTLNGNSIMITRNASLIRSFALVALFTLFTSSAHAYTFRSLTTDIWNGGSSAAAQYGTTYTSTTVERIEFINHSDASPINTPYNQAADTIDVSPWVVNGASRGTGVPIKVNGFNTSGSVPGAGENLYLRGESNVNNEGFGAHANWIVTFDLDDIRTEHFGGTTNPIGLTGDFGIWGGAGAPEEAQGVIFLDGVRIDSMDEALASPTTNRSFNLSIDSGRWLTFGIFNGNGIGDTTTWDDAIFQNVTLSVVPEPSTGLLLLVGVTALSVRRRRSGSVSWIPSATQGIACIVAMFALASIAAQAHAGVFYSQTVLADNPVGYWRLGETSGTTAVNSGTGGAGINATYSNFPPGVQGAGGLINVDSNRAADLDGTTQTAADAVLTGTGLNSVAGGNPFANDWSIEAWFVRDSVNAWSAIFSNNNGSTQGPLMTFNSSSNLLGINGAGVTANNVSVDVGASLGDEIYAVITKTGGNGPSASTLTVYANVDGT